MASRTNVKKCATSTVSCAAKSGKYCQCSSVKRWNRTPDVTVAAGHPGCKGKTPLCPHTIKTRLIVPAQWFYPYIRVSAANSQRQASIPSLHTDTAITCLTLLRSCTVGCALFFISFDASILPVGICSGLNPAQVGTPEIVIRRSSGAHRTKSLIQVGISL